jgi:single-strand DNA-binding protein
MEIKAILKALQPIVERGDFKSRKVWLTVPDEKYPQVIEVEVQQSKVDMFDNIAVGAPVLCHINLRGREWTDPQGVVKVFNSLVCWRVESDNTVYAAQKGDTGINHQETTLPELKDDSGEKLPF